MPTYRMVSECFPLPFNMCPSCFWKSFVQYSNSHSTPHDWRNIQYVLSDRTGWNWDMNVKKESGKASRPAGARFRTAASSCHCLQPSTCRRQVKCLLEDRLLMRKQSRRFLGFLPGQQFPIHSRALRILFAEKKRTRVFQCHPFVHLKSTFQSPSFTTKPHRRFLLKNSFAALSHLESFRCHWVVGNIPASLQAAQIIPRPEVHVPKHLEI